MHSSKECLYSGFAFRSQLATVKHVYGPLLLLHFPLKAPFVGFF